ncbi:MAG: response regulator [Actinomycetia bacterium]|nr:response regulator [Actinomycetes bacterium]
MLVVDDEPVSLQVLANQLALESDHVELAASGSEALALAAKRAFDLVVLDVMMPRMSGIRGMPGAARAPLARGFAGDLPDRQEPGVGPGGGPGGGRQRLPGEADRQGRAAGAGAQPPGAALGPPPADAGGRRSGGEERRAGAIQLHRFPRPQEPADRSRTSSAWSGATRRRVGPKPGARPRPYRVRELGKLVEDVPLDQITRCSDSASGWKRRCRIASAARSAPRCARCSSRRRRTLRRTSAEGGMR